ncbi:hypothetical protein AB6805_14905 [Chitinophaga sp. RCC_12]|uniref:hypothetical protein n=1 Tax=Chitinophaga sp. RCC_12 TaxID=3239226 RepID=UPI003524DB25
MAMIEAFPQLKNNEVALLRAKRKTGHVIDDNFQLAVSISQRVFTVFDDVNTALHFAKEIIKRNNDIEVCIYEKDNVLLHFITADNINPDIKTM